MLAARRDRHPNGPPRRRVGRGLLGLVAVLVAAASLASTASARADLPPLLAYYYIWFNVSSWNRAKIDYPLIGRYSSDEPSIVREQIRQAKRAGIDGFIVSWKYTPVLDRRLRLVVDIAAHEHFKLAIVYEGLDFGRHPLPVVKVASDLDQFIRRYAGSRVFDLFEKPVVIWSGSWEFSRRQVQRVTQPRRERLLILGSEKNAADYRAKAPLFDGDAYYWSSVNPDTYPNYLGKLREMSSAIHATGGLWFAPAAPGYDARPIGGSTVVERHDGNTLRQEMDTAMQSNPDAVGLISWNEFSENTHVEPSRKYGVSALKLLADIRGTHLKPRLDFGSDEPGGTGGTLHVLPIVAIVAALTVVGLYALVRRGRGKAAS
jgi:hypothetical protein